jgi:hypothetical protein
MVTATSQGATLPPSDLSSVDIEASAVKPFREYLEFAQS